MNDFVRDAPAREALALACRDRGITGPEDFFRRYGISPASLTPAVALALVTTPEWVTAIWMPNASGTPVVWVPAAVRTYAAVYGVAQLDGESDHAFNDRLRQTIAARQAIR